MLWDYVVIYFHRGEMMRIVVAMDSFKGSLSSEETGNAVKAGILGILVPCNFTTLIHCIIFS